MMVDGVMTTRGVVNNHERNYRAILHFQQHLVFAQLYDNRHSLRQA